MMYNKQMLGRGAEEETAKFPPVYRMQRCKKCWLHCKPCLTEEEAVEILGNASIRQYEGTDLCQQCHKKSNRTANRKNGGKTPTPRTVADLELELAALQAALRKLGVKI